MDNNNGGNKFLNGFLLGALIGAGAVFLLSSKKGKKILKTLSEEGLDNISDLLQEQEEVVENDEEDEKANSVNNSQQNQKEQNGGLDHNADQKEQKPFVRRFFRGISRKR